MYIIINLWIYVYIKLLYIYIYIYNYYTHKLFYKLLYLDQSLLSKEVSKSNFRQYGQMKSRARQRQREEKDQKREDQRRERVRRKKMQMREKVGKSRNTMFFQ